MALSFRFFDIRGGHADSKHRFECLIYLIVFYWSFFGIAPALNCYLNIFFVERCFDFIQKLLDILDSPELFIFGLGLKKLFERLIIFYSFKNDTTDEIFGWVDHLYQREITDSRVYCKISSEE